jgi:hypothetical protein
MRITILACALLIAGSAIALAQETPPPTPPPGKAKTPVINKRQADQRARIRQGVRSGELTPGEAHQLRKKERQIQKDKKDAKSDGVVTPQERRQIKKEENKVSKDIYKKKHNDVKRPDAK